MKDNVEEREKTRVIILELTSVFAKLDVINSIQSYKLYINLNVLHIGW